MTVPGDVDRPQAVTVFGACLATESDTVRLLDDLIVRVGTDPASASHSYVSYRAAKQDLAEIGDQLHPTSHGRPAQSSHAFSKSEFFERPLPTEAVARLVDNLRTQNVPGQARELDFTPWGGAYNRVPADATAFAHRNARFLLKHEVRVDPTASPDERGVARRWLARSWVSVHPWGSGGVYPNFPDPDLKDWGLAYYGTNYDRLVRIKQRYDPDNFFAFQHSLPGHPEAGSAGDNDVIGA